MKVLNGTITSPKGFLAAGEYVGIKKEKKDMALVVSEVPAISAGTFTTNVVKAAPVLWDQDVVDNYETVRAFVINSGVANACTGKIGDQDNENFAKYVAKKLNIEPKEVLVASTGVIGKLLPMDKIYGGVDILVPNLEAGHEAGIKAAQAIMTTDTKEKHISVEFEIQGTTVTIGAMCKGSGMIHPNMATMLGFITSDVAISKELLVKALKDDIKDTFNMISVDGDTSTNDSVMMMANGMANNPIIDKDGDDYNIFKEALNVVNTFLAKKIAEDGEGATKLLEVKVVNASDKDKAVVISKSVCTSSLVKTAVFGNDANWGRILCAMGYSGKTFDPYLVDLHIESEFGLLQLVENGMATDYSEEIATKILSAKELTAIIDLKEGNEIATAWGCDLTYDYVKINADYRS